MRSEIPLLQNVRVASPCHASWEEMAAVDGDRVRFCDGCHKRVYNLSALGQAEAEGLLRTHEGRLCVRYYRRSDGTILTADCPVGLRAARQMVLTRTRVSLGLCLLLCLAFASEHALTRSMGAPVAGRLSPAVSPPVVGGVSPVPQRAVPEPPNNRPLMGMARPMPEVGNRGAELGRTALIGEVAAPEHGGSRHGGDVETRGGVTR